MQFQRRGLGSQEQLILRFGAGGKREGGFGQIRRVPCDQSVRGKFQHLHLSEPPIDITCHQLRFGGIAPGQQTAGAAPERALQGLAFDTRARQRGQAIQGFGERQSVPK